MRLIWRVGGVAVLMTHVAFARGANPSIYGFVLEIGILVP